MRPQQHRALLAPVSLLEMTVVVSAAPLHDEAGAPPPHHWAPHRHAIPRQGPSRRRLRLPEARERLQAMPPPRWPAGY